MAQPWTADAHARGDLLKGRFPEAVYSQDVERRFDDLLTAQPALGVLAETHDSGDHSWTAATKEAYANDQGDPRSLVAVTASSNRGKGDQDPGEWLPLLERCRSIGEWLAVKHRWDLTVDQVEKDALTLQASNCDDVTITVIEP